MDTAKNQITPAIEEQIYSVNYNTGMNMLDCHAVMRIADREGCHEIADYLSDRKNWPDYKHFILTGDNFNLPGFLDVCKKKRQHTDGAARKRACSASLTAPSAQAHLKITNLRKEECP